MSARMKTVPADFIVQEELDFTFDGEGEHLYLYVRKCGLNTSDVQEHLQQQFKCQSVDIGLSGLKDKNAITDQWFSIRTALTMADTTLSILPSGDVTTLSVGEFGVLEHHRHSRKLRRGAHRHNRFIITLRDVEWRSASADVDSTNDSLNKNINNHEADEPFRHILEQRLRLIQEQGFANYFGPQRFGHGQQNLPNAERYFANPKRKMSRTKRSLLISAARSHLFNNVCAKRVSLGNWNVPLSGEPMLLNDTNSFFINESSTESSVEGSPHDSPAADVFERCQRHDIHPTGPMWGEGQTLATGECQQLETDVLHNDTSFRQGLEKAGLKQQRRALRANVESLGWQWQEPAMLSLDFKLLKGVYATSFLSEFMINL